MIDDEGWESGLDAGASIEVTVTDNPVVARLYGPAGEVLIERREREPIGFRQRRPNPNTPPPPAAP